MHRKLKARNETVSKLRELLRKGSVSLVKEFTKTIKVNKKAYVRYSKPKRWIKKK